jgi:hypothetical protein
MLDLKFRFLDKPNPDDSTKIASTPYLKRYIKTKFYSRLPLLVGPFFYFVLRYIFLLGFIDGYPGLLFHFLQGFWYRALVDAKVYQFRKQLKYSKNSPTDTAEIVFGTWVSKYLKTDNPIT